MTDLAAFTNRPDCIKCGSGVFDWHWYLPSSIGGDADLRDKEFPPVDHREHLRLTCENCGWVFAMQTKDAETA